VKIIFIKLVQDYEELKIENAKIFTEKEDAIRFAKIQVEQSNHFQEHNLRLQADKDELHNKFLTATIEKGNLGKELADRKHDTELDIYKLTEELKHTKSMNTELTNNMEASRQEAAAAKAEILRLDNLEKQKDELVDNLKKQRQGLLADKTHIDTLQIQFKDKLDSVTKREKAVQDREKDINDKEEILKTEDMQVKEEFERLEIAKQDVNGFTTNANLLNAINKSKAEIQKMVEQIEREKTEMKKREDQLVAEHRKVREERAQIEEERITLPVAQQEVLEITPSGNSYQLTKNNAVRFLVAIGLVYAAAWLVHMFKL